MSEHTSFELQPDASWNRSYCADGPPVRNRMQESMLATIVYRSGDLR